MITNINTIYSGAIAPITEKASFGDLITQEPSRKRFLTSKAVNFLFMMMLFTTVYMASPTFAAAALTSAQSLLSKAATAGGGLWAVWGLVQLGMSIKDHNGPGIQGAIWQIIGGAIIIAAASVISSLDLTMS